MPIAAGGSPSSSIDSDHTPTGGSRMLTPNRVLSSYPSFISSVMDSPSASITLLRTNETLAGLSRQLTELEHSRLLESDPDLSARCCCGALADCPMLSARDRLDVKLKLCGEIGTALLQRYEALELKYNRAEAQLEIKRRALSDSLRHVANLERANTTHLQKYAEQTRAYEALEKRYTQTLHSQTLTQQSLAHVRGELTKSRASYNTQSVLLAAGGGDDGEGASDAERRFEDARTLYHSESRKLREELKWRRMAEERIADLEAKLTTAGREVEDAKAARAKDAQDLLANAKERLGALHEELSSTFHADHPAESPEYLRTLEDLVATNTLLKHDTSELARTLSLTLEENRVLKDELDELRQPLSTELRPLLMRNHSRNSSNQGHTRVTSIAHKRNSSIAPSCTSTSTDAVTSPSPLFSPLMSGADSPELARRRSSSISYVHNGVPKRRRARVSVDSRRSLTMRALGEPLIEDRGLEDQSNNSEETHSGDDSITSEASRKRASVLLPGRLNFDVGLSEAQFDLPPYDAVNPQSRLGRRTLLLLSRSMGVQTDAIEEEMKPSHDVSQDVSEDTLQDVDVSMSTAEMSASTHSPRKRESGASFDAPALSQLVEFLVKILTRLRGVNIATLNRRLKKQNLPSDVGHLSRSTISALQSEVAGIRHSFRGLLDSSTVTRKDLGLLLTLLKDVFSDLIELQSTVNNVTLDPKLAKKLRRDAFDVEEAPAAGFWGIAAPITNYFKAPEAAPPPEPAPKRPPPKVAALASTASVTVEIGGPRAAPASPKKSRIGVVAGGDVFLEERRPMTAQSRSVSAPVQQATLNDTGRGGSQRVRSRASRSDLMGIFAGAQRTAVAPRLSTVVDAVLDPDLESAVDDADGPLLQRTLRPRGLSDSSIRVTAPPLSPAMLSPAPATTACPVPARAHALVTQTMADGNVASGMLGNIKKSYGPISASSRLPLPDFQPSGTIRALNAMAAMSPEPTPGSLPRW